MADLDKVIKGLECCTADIIFPMHQDDYCAECPYKETQEGIWYCFHKRDLMLNALELLKAQRWVSVKDMLPEERINPNTNDFEYVLCATTFGDVRAYKYGMMDGNTEGHFWHGFGIMDKYVTRWMPLPEQPKEGYDGRS